MTLHSIVPAIVFSALLAGSAAAAQDAPPAGAMAGGGMMPPRSADAVTPWAERLFARLDANQDAAVTGDEMAMLTRPEIASRGGGRLRAMISQSDAIRDARVSQEELAAGALRMFTRMDVNGDGQLADDEMPRPPAPPRPMSIPMPPAQPTMPMPDGSED